MEHSLAAGAIDGSGDAAVGAAAATIAAEGGRLAFAAEAVVGACIGLEGLGATGAGAGMLTVISAEGGRLARLEDCVVAAAAASVVVAGSGDAADGACATSAAALGASVFIGD